MINIPFYPDTIPIVFSSNDYSVPYMATNMQSIMENANQNKKYCFFVLYRDISGEYMNLLKKQIAIYNNFAIYFVNVSEYFNGVNFFTSRHITVEAYFRLLIPYLFVEYHKVLYLDGDMICCTDIASLYDINLENYLLAAVRDTGVSWYYSPEHSEKMKALYSVLLRLKKPDEYFCSAMCIFNIELFHKTISTDEILKLAASRDWHVHDQDVLNYLAEGKTLLLPYHWNLMITPNTNYLPEHLKNEYNTALERPNIIHYKPWNHDIYVTHFELFWKYATRTPFINTIIERMKSKELITNGYEPFDKRVISNIIHRKGIGLRFLLIDCIKAWLSRDKK